jgi:acyl dehydratase
MSTTVERPGWPTIGVKLGPERIVVDEARVEQYLACVDDTTFRPAHADAMEAHFGYSIAPATVLDGELGSRIFRIKYGILGDSLHAAQEFQFHRPLRIGVEYEMTAEVENIYYRRGIEFVVVRGWCRDDEGLCITQRYIKAMDVPQEREGSGAPQAMSIADFVAKHGGSESALFPAVGAVVMGGERTVEMATSELFSRVKDTDLPNRPNIHTDPKIAEGRGFGRPIMKGLLSTVSEAQLYREVFGADWYTRGHLTTKYVRPCPVGSQLKAVGVVTESDDKHVVLKSAVASDGVIVTVGEAGIE